MERPLSTDPIQHLDTNDRLKQWRNWSGFWLIGLCNNFAYVVMLSAAQDILTKQESENATIFNKPGDTYKDVNTANSNHYDCNSVSTAAVLLADILPTLIIKLSAPLVIHKVPYGFRILFCVIMAATSFLVVSFSSTVWMSIIGVIFASTSAGFGELSFLSLTVFYSRDVLGAWGSGTGGAGVFGALLYSGLTQVGLSPQVTLLIMLTIPFTMLISYFFLLVPPPSFLQWKHSQSDNTIETSEERQQLMAESEEQEMCSQEDRRPGLLTLTEKLLIFKMELLYFRTFFLTHAEQYRWYQTIYQVGVFLSRSSLCCMKIRKLWGLALLQVLNAVLLLLEVSYQFLPSVWLVFTIIFYEGLLGGTAYVNTFYFISKETEDRQREFAMAAASVGDSLGIALAAVTAFPVHRYFCSL
ncbi:battenin isoform X2 [Festucalex cinctus]